SGYANINETLGNNNGTHNLQRTTAVGLYPNGNSHQGIADLSGNVWEWCLNEYDTPENRPASKSLGRAVRGGSWFHFKGYARATYRYLSRPLDFRIHDLGFRVCCVYPILNTVDCGGLISETLLLCSLNQLARQSIYWGGRSIDLQYFYLP
ncbi:MAG TPA: SUMF1/EgtB/PvdO family nonheme iron enzyme, partial [Methylococcales bacterium]